MFGIVLDFHIAAALFMGAVALVSLVDIALDRKGNLRRFAILLAWGFGIECVTGSALAVLSPDGISFLHFCRNIAIYFVATGLIETLLFVRMKTPFPSTSALVPVLPSLAVTSVTAVSLL